MELTGFVLLSTLAACALAGVAVLVGRFAGSPRLRHLLWLLVLARLIAPPGLELGLLPKPDFPREAPGAIVSTPVLAEVRAGSERGVPELSASAPVGVELESAEGHSGAGRMPKVPVWLALWAGGGALLILLYGWQWRRFSASLAGLEPADASITSRAVELAGQLGLGSVPRVLVSRRDRPPMVLPSLWRPRILLPARLIEILTDDDMVTAGKVQEKSSQSGHAG